MTSESIDEAINSVLSHNTDHCHSCSKQEQEVKQMRAKVEKLETQINFLLSFLGISNSSLDNDLIYHVEGSHGFRMDNGGSKTGAILKSGSVTANLEPNPGKVVHSYAAAASIAKLSEPMRQAVVSAVYTDLKTKERKSNNIIISGLSSNVSVSDTDLAKTFLDTEFGRKPEVLRSRRLGNDSVTRVRPLLVTLGSVDQAQYFIIRAKNLRSSTDRNTRDKVFINADLTKAEAKSAYEARCRRRQTRDVVHAIPTEAASSVVQPQVEFRLPLPPSDSFPPLVVSMPGALPTTYIVPATAGGTLALPGSGPTTTSTPTPRTGTLSFGPTSLAAQHCQLGLDEHQPDSA
jgi:hypothetical protein